jgi:hypothetical protein
METELHVSNADEKHVEAYSGWNDPKTIKRYEEIFAREKELGNFDEQELDDIRFVGEEKPLGYLPIHRIELIGAQVEDLAEEARVKGLEVAIFPQEMTGVWKGCLFVYHKAALAKLIERHVKELTNESWPVSPDEFVAKVASTKVLRENKPQLHSIIAEAFNDTSNRS